MEYIGSGIYIDSLGNKVHFLVSLRCLPTAAHRNKCLDVPWVVGLWHTLGQSNTWPNGWHVPLQHPRHSSNPVCIKAERPLLALVSQSLSFVLYLVPSFS